MTLVQHWPAAVKADEQLTCKIAASRADREAAFRLVYDAYLRAGLGRPNAYRMRVTPYHLLSTTEVFIALIHDEIRFTVSFVGDGALGLPMETVYGAEVADARRKGYRLAEISCLADHQTDRRQFFEMFYSTSQLLAQYAQFHGYDQLLIAAHPRHARFYQKYLKFESIGGLTEYPTVQNHPAVALCLDFATSRREHPDRYDDYFGQKLPPEVLQACPMSDSDSAYFREFIDPTFRIHAKVLDCGMSYLSESPVLL